MLAHLTPLAAILWIALSPARASAQTDVALEVGASQIGPALGVDAEAARYAMAGLRASSYGNTGSGIFASVLAGRVFGDSVGGSFISGLIEATARGQWTEHWSGGLDARMLAFRVEAPFPYKTFALELNPSIRRSTTHTSLELGLLGGIGQSEAEFWRRVGDQVFVFDDYHSRLGATAEFLVGSPEVKIGFAGSTHRASEERYSSAGARAVWAGSWGVLELRIDRWDTPVGYETTGGLTVGIPFGGWSLRSFLGRSDPDPLTLAQPGSGSGGVLLGRSLYSTPRTDGRTSLHEVLEYGDARSLVRVTVRAPAGASRVEVLGDFSLWEPIPMRFEGGAWTAEVEVPVGTHHFGFLVDDQWYMPDDARDVAPDEWGRRTATLVIEGAG